MYQTFLEEITRQMEEDGDQMQPACSPESLKQLEATAQAIFSRGLPVEYFRFLSLTNGLDWNGLMIYASATTPIVKHDEAFIHGLIEANLLWRDYKPNEKFLIFGESGLSKYVYAIASSEYQVIDRSSMDAVKSVASFDELMAEALENHL
jgi:hypothetical protein